MDKRPQILMSAQASASLARVRPTGDAVKKDTSVAEMLSQLHAVAGTLLQELAITDAPTAKRLAMAKDMAKLIPLLAIAERKVRKGWKNKDVEDMTDRELEQARRSLKVVKAR